MKSHHYKQQGTVLILALLMLVLVEVIIISIMEFHRFGVMYTQDLKSYHQSVQLLLGGEKWATGLIKNARLNEVVQAEYTLQATQTPWGVMQGKVTDAQSLVNLNQARGPAMGSFEHFLEQVFDDDFEEDKLIVIEAMKTRALPSVKSSSVGKSALQIDNGSKSLSLHQKTIFSVTELLSKTDISKEGYRRLLPHITAIPELIGLNINTASKEALFSLSPDITPEQVKAIIQARQEKLFDEKNPLQNLEALKDLKLGGQSLSYRSQFYLAEITVSNADDQIKLYNLMKLNDKDDAIEVSVLWRSFGTL